MYSKPNPPDSLKDINAVYLKFISDLLTSMTFKVSGYDRNRASYETLRTMILVLEGLIYGNVREPHRTHLLEARDKIEEQFDKGIIRTKTELALRKFGEYQRIASEAGLDRLDNRMSHVPWKTDQQQEEDEP